MSVLADSATKSAIADKQGMSSSHDNQIDLQDHVLAWFDVHLSEQFAFYQGLRYDEISLSRIPKCASERKLE
jgi:hypothetical protein